jgi:20S proteasome alpha/beta subunit
MGVLERLQGNHDCKGSKKTVTRSIKSAVSRDSMSGDGIDFLIINKEGKSKNP